MTQPMPPMSQPPQQPVAAPNGSYPGKTLGIVGLIVSFFASLIGLILSIVAYSQSKKAGYKNTPALIGIILGAVLLVIGIIVAIILGTVFAGLIAQCADLGPGTHYVDGVTYTCS
ncbi:DUF4190 domain-containing protein [Microbacterium sp. RG1]|uniref:DUF4190 domain-containing protein n=1 Tax=Microbacterium sp. RG1 TaxID=2489212 RepID=UPI0010CA23C0|nr:DUF4190 domain-containing protein [Microbacterium sp. RG1]QCQ17654.1 DUF4190 domain-containing protein [Microbacterium sp. RG1]